MPNDIGGPGVCGTAVILFMPASKASLLMTITATAITVELPERFPVIPVVTNAVAERPAFPFSCRHSY